MILFSRGHATLHLAMSVGNIFEFRAVFALLLLPNRLRLGYCVSDLVCDLQSLIYRFPSHVWLGRGNERESISVLVVGSKMLENQPIHLKDLFLVACTRLYTPLCPSVGRLVGRSVGWSVGPLFTFSAFLSVLSSLLLPKCPSDLLYHCPCPPARD